MVGRVMAHVSFDRNVAQNLEKITQDYDILTATGHIGKSKKVQAYIF